MDIDQSAYWEKLFTKKHKCDYCGKRRAIYNALVRPAYKVKDLRDFNICISGIVIAAKCKNCHEKEYKEEVKCQ